ncbi:MAG: M20/M25/M40 family metallo-hydrolase [Candidatus Lokiarchaeota archaeon]|nr:M20/M25/M40 family metallo-hydrolase [Candidatus Lokiarchaeota archaeon]
MAKLNEENDFGLDLKLLKTISELRGCSGHEEKVRKFIKEIITPFCDEIKTDVMGNLYAKLNGESEKNSILLAAHMDEIGFMVRYIDDKGYLRVASVGGQNIRLIPGSKVSISGKSGDVPGVFGEKAIHLIKRKNRDKTTPIEEVFLDIGTNSREETEKYVQIGDFIEFIQDFMRFPNTNKICGKAFDDRLGCYILIHLLKELSKVNNRKNTVIFVFTTQEEIGVNGAKIICNNELPQSAVVLEVTHAIDYPTVSKEKEMDIEQGKGPSISIGPNLHPKISKRLIKIAKQEDIPFQIEPASGLTGTDARVIQTTGTGVPVGLMSVPLRYMHTMIEVADLEDISNLIKILKVYLLKKQDGNYLL